MTTRITTLALRVWPLIRRYGFDVLVLVGALESSLELVYGREHNKDAPTGSLWVLIPLTLLFFLPLLARRRYPFGAPAAVFIYGAAVSFLNGRVVTFPFGIFLSVLTCSFLFGMLPERRQAVSGLGIALGAAAIVTRNHPTQGAGDFLFIAILFTIVWLAGNALGAKLTQYRQAEERAERQEREREALLIVEQTGREALAEMRRLVGVLRRPEEAPALAPQPSLQHLDKLVEQAREAGLPVDVQIEGEAKELPAGVDLTAYRLVQEALTNAIKHAKATKAEVLVRYEDGLVELNVVDDGQGASDGSSESGGHGLVGMRERVTVYGGELEAGPRPNGGFALKARLPTS